MEFAVVGGAIIKAAAEGNLERLKQLAESFNSVEAFKGMRKMAKKDGWVALHAAAAAGKTHICKYFIEKLKLDVDLKSEKEGHTPLFLTVMFNHLPTAMYLIESGADVNGSYDEGISALHFAVSRGSIKMMKLLISKGANLNAMSPAAGTPLQVASVNGDKDAVRLLLDNKSDPNLSSILFFPPVLSLVAADLLESLAMLFKAGANPNVRCSGSTPLHLAASKTRTEFVKLLLNAGADPDVVDMVGLTPLEDAAMCFNLAVMKILFPVTSPIPSITNWSIHGVMSYVKSKGLSEKVICKLKGRFELERQMGAAAFKKNDYRTALHHFREAYNTGHDDAPMLSNMSLCLALIGVGDDALSDALACVELRPDWPKAHYREGVARMILKEYSMAVLAFSRALKLDPKNEEIQRALKDAVESDYTSKFGAMNMPIAK